MGGIGAERYYSPPLEAFNDATRLQTTWRIRWSEVGVGRMRVKREQLLWENVCVCGVVGGGAGGKRFSWAI